MIPFLWMTVTDDVTVTEVESQEGKDDFTMYCISGLDKGSTVFANGVLLGLGVD